MKRSIKTSVILVGSMFLVLQIQTASAQPRAELPAFSSVRELAEYWLLKDCGLGTGRELEEEILVNRFELEPLFISAFRQGPPAEVAANNRANAMRQYELIRSQAELTSLGLSQDDQAQLRRIATDDFVRQEQVAFDSRYRSRALAGLAVTGGKAGLKVLRSIAQSADSPFKQQAEQLLSERRAGK